MNPNRSALRLALRLVQIALLAGLGLLVAFVALVVGFALLLGAGSSMYVYEVEPSPDRMVSMVTTVDMSGGVTVGPTNNVAIVGDRFDRKVEIGAYEHGGWEPGDGWRGSRTVNVCMLRFPMTEPGDVKSVAAVVTAAGRAETVRVTRECPAEFLKEMEGQGS